MGGKEGGRKGVREGGAEGEREREREQEKTLIALTLGEGHPVLALFL